MTEEEISKDITKTCGDCQNYNPDNGYEDDILGLGIIHVCDKGAICNPWNYTNNCKDFKPI